MFRSQSLPSIPTWELKHSKPALQKLALKPAMFARGYRMQAIDPSTLKFPSFESCCIPMPIPLGDLQRKRLPAYVGVDLSSTSRPGNAIAVVGLEPQSNRRIMLEILFGNWTSPKLAAVLSEINNRHNVQYIQVENNGYQQALVDWIRESKGENSYWMKVEPFTTGNNKAREDIGLPGLEVEFFNKSWMFPYQEWEGHEPGHECDWCRLSREFSLYPQAATTDGVMATWFARDALNKWAPITTVPGAPVGNLNLR